MIKKFNLSKKHYIYNPIQDEEDDKDEEDNEDDDNKDGQKEWKIKINATKRQKSDRHHLKFQYYCHNWFEDFWEDCLKEKSFYNTLKVEKYIVEKTAIKDIKNAIEDLKSN